MNFKTIEIIVIAQKGEESALLKLIEKFDPLLKKYANKLDDLDAYQNLRVDFIEFILNIDIENIRIPSEARIVNYISTSVYHIYIKQSILLNYSRKILLLSDLSEAQNIKIEEQSAIKEKYINSNLEYALNKLTSNEKELIHLIFYKEQTIPEIAKLYGTSRQAINQKKIRILKKMKCILTKYEEGIQ